ncbi:MAG: glycosyltransferase family 4 protein [Anaerolineae bacterium]|nr:glycosyltransferase family 4 protein [Anaerolineae bacterium]
MRVAINAWFWNSPTTGSGQYTQRLVEGLTALGQDLEIILVTTEQKQEARSKRQENPASCRLHPVRCSRSNLGKVWFEQVAFPSACRRLHVDVAHVPYWAPPLRPTIPTVVTIHDLIPLLLHEYRGGPLVRLYTALVGYAARSAALALTDSAFSRQDIIAHLGLAPGRVRAIHLAAGDDYTPTPTPTDADVRARYSLPERYVLYLGGFDVRKNVAALIDAYHRAAPTIGETHPLVIAGRLPENDTPFSPDPRRLARERGVVRFIAFPDDADKPALYRGATAFIFPSRYEGFGLPPLEALACGTPVVGSDASSIPEIVGDGGLLLPPDDVEGMAQALSRLATDADFRAELSQRALAQAARFSWEQTAQETLAAYRDAASQA